MKAPGTLASILDCHSWGGGFSWHIEGRGKDAARPLGGTGQPPNNRAIRPQMSMVPLPKGVLEAGDLSAQRQRPDGQSLVVQEGG